jgi:hypothetical protein
MLILLAHVCVCSKLSVDFELSVETSNPLVPLALSGKMSRDAMRHLREYKNTCILTIALNVQKWYTLTGTQHSDFVVRWRGIAPNGPAC